MPKLTINVDSSQAVQAIRELEDEFGELDKQIKYVEKSSSLFSKNMKKTLGAVGGILAGGFAISGVSKFGGYLADISDQYTLIDAKINLITKDQDQFNDSYSQLYELSKDTGTTLEGNAQAFAKLGNAMPNAEYQEVIGYLTTVNQSLITSGATTQEAAGFMIQFAQAMGTGVVNGDELRTMNEANSYLMRKIAKEFDTTTAGLKALGAANLLTTEKFAAALQKVSKEVKDTYEDIPETIKRALNKLDQVWKNILGGADESTNASRTFVSAINDMSGVVESNGPQILELFAAISTAATFGIEGVSGLVNAIKGFAAVAAGELNFFELMKSDAAELAVILDKIDNGLSEEEKTTERIRDLNKEIQKTKSERPWTQDGRDQQEAELRSLRNKREYFRKELQELKKEASTVAGEGAKFEASLDLDTTKAEAALSSLEKMQKNSSEKWLQENEKAAEKSIKKYTKELERANQAVVDSTRDFAADTASLRREGMTDDQAWADVINQIDTYKQKAQEAAKAGEWDSQLDYLERAKNLISELNSEGTTKLVTDDAVENARKIWEYQQRITRGGKSAYGDAAKPYKEARENYMRLLRDRKKGETESISKQDALNSKIKISEELQSSILEAKKEAASRTEKEKTDLEATVAAHKEAAGQMVAANKDVETSVDSVEDAWVKTGDKWKSVSGEIVNDIGDIIEKLQEMDRLAEPYTSGKSFSASDDQKAIEGRATGGPVSANTPYWVGEKGEPELFVPDRSGTIVPLNETQSNQPALRPISLHFNDSEPINVFGDQKNLIALQQAEQDQRRYAG